MSRVCIKNLPAYVTEARLRETFGSKGVITDVKILKTKGGQSRHMAFVGYRDEASARSAVSFFNRTFLDTAKLSVEIARSVKEDVELGAAGRGKGRTKGVEGRDGVVGGAGGASSLPTKKRKAEEPAPAPQPPKDDTKLREFLALMKSRNSTATWANDDGGRGKAGKSATAAKPSKSKKAKLAEDEGWTDSSDGSDSDEYQELLTVPAVGADASSDDDEDEEEEEEEEEEEDDAVKKDKQSKVVDGKKGKGKGKGKKGEEVEAEDVAESGRLFVRNLPYCATEADITALFSKYGTLSSSHLAVDDSKRSKGFAFVEYMFPENAVLALGELDGTVFQGRVMHVLPARDAPVALRDKDGEGNEGGAGKRVAKGYKAEMEEKKRAAAADASSESVWNPLYVRSDAAIQALAKQYGMKEGEILDRDADNMATRVALAETHVITQTKQFLEAEGVRLSAVEAALRGTKVERSDSCILVKNLPATADEGTLREKFGRFGALRRVVLPPLKLVALIEFFQADDAKRAFKSLAYTKFERVPLYLEWAPVDVFTVAAPAHNDTVAAPTPAAARPAAAVAVASVAPATAATTPDDGTVISSECTLYVKNLNFATTEEGLRSMFAHIGPVRAVFIPKKRKATADGGKEMVSMGYGFVEFDGREHALEAIKKLQSAVLDDHSLQLKLSSKKIEGPEVTRKQTTAAVAPPKDKKVAKLLVKNLAFEATKKDLRELFGAFGQLKVVRIPRKFDGSHRGFGFVEFLTHQEAANAMKALASSHLYGRHLVLEWAAEDTKIPDE